MSESPIDDLFESIYGFRPNKKGTSYEYLVAAAFKLISANLEVKANQFVKGTYSKEKYQIDAILETLRIAIEAKDYTEQGSKVGRPDITKLAGALQDLPFESGIVASATEFTHPAKKFAEATKENPTSKPINLFHIRPSVDSDREGRIQTIVIKLHVLTVDHNNLKFQPVFTTQGTNQLLQIYKDGELVSIRVDKFYKSDGSILLTVYDLTTQINKNSIAVVIEGSWIPPEPAFIKIQNQLIEISEFKYYIPHIVMESEIVVEAKGKAQLLIKAEDGSVDKLLTDIDLKNVSFTDSGNVNLGNNGLAT